MRQEKVTLTKAELKVLVVEKILDERITNAKGVLIIGISEASDQTGKLYGRRSKGTRPPQLRQNVKTRLGSEEIK